MFSHKDYEEIVNKTIDQIHSLSKHKGGEYAGDTDRLANFRRNAASLGLSMEQVWAVYAAKHWDAIQQYVKDIASGTERVRLEPIEGRADDLIVYLILFKAIERERQISTVVNQLIDSEALACKATPRSFKLTKDEMKEWPYA